MGSNSVHSCSAVLNVGQTVYQFQESLKFAVGSRANGSIDFVPKNEKAFISVI